MKTEKKVEIITKSGRIIKVMPHLLSDLAKFEATPKRPTVKPTPRELLNIPAGAKPTILPKMEVTEVPEEVPVEEKKVRKPPVRSKTK